MAQLLIKCKSFFSFLAGTSPRIVIDGAQNTGSFSNTNTYDISAGTHHIKVFRPYPIFMFPTCSAQTIINVDDGDVISIQYKLAIFIFLPGSLVIESHKKAPSHKHSPIINSKNSQSIPDICPHCKNPNTKRIRLCEWCGNQIC